jgi:branched-chain amino acid transport system ATP-binding protein
VLIISGITVCYGDTPVLWDISLEVRDGEIVTVIGPNGAGKTTLLHTIVNLIRPIKGGHDSGIYFKTRRIDVLSPEDTVNLGIAIVPEGSRVFPDLSVLDNLKIGASSKRARDTRERSLQEVYQLFPRLLERTNQKARTLSGGERQPWSPGLSRLFGGSMIRESPSFWWSRRSISPSRSRIVPMFWKMGGSFWRGTRGNSSIATM